MDDKTRPREGSVPDGVGPYELVERLSDGGFGSVFRARHGVLGRLDAVKVLHARISYGSAAHARFLREGQLLARFRGPAFPVVYGTGVDPDGRAWLAMELLDGPALAACLQARGAMTLAALLPLLRTLGDALATLHAAGVVHHDVKPANVVMVETPEGQRPVLVDFGLAIGNGPADPTLTTGIGGSPPFSAPEQMRPGRADPRSDQYALAVLCIACLTADAASIEDTVGATGAPRARPKLDARLPTRLHPVLLRALAREPTGRFPDIQAFVDAFVAAAATDRRHAELVGLLAPPGQLVDRRGAAAARLRLNAGDDDEAVRAHIAHALARGYLEARDGQLVPSPDGLAEWGVDAPASGAMPSVATSTLRGGAADLLGALVCLGGRAPLGLVPEASGPALAEVRRRRLACVVDGEDVLVTHPDRALPRPWADEAVLALRAGVAREVARLRSPTPETLRLGLRAALAGADEGATATLAGALARVLLAEGSLAEARHVLQLAVMRTGSPAFGPELLDVALSDPRRMESLVLPAGVVGAAEVLAAHAAYKAGQVPRLAEEPPAGAHPLVGYWHHRLRVATLRGSVAEAQAAVARAAAWLDAHPDPDMAARRLNLLANHRLRTGDHEAAGAIWDRAAATARRPDLRLEAQYGALYAALGAGRAREVLERGPAVLEAARALGIESRVANVLVVLREARLALGSCEAADPGLLAELRGTGLAAGNLALVEAVAAHHRGEPAEVRARCAEALRAYAPIADQPERLLALALDAAAGGAGRPAAFEVLADLPRDLPLAARLLALQAVGLLAEAAPDARLRAHFEDLCPATSPTQPLLVMTVAEARRYVFPQVTPCSLC